MSENVELKIRIKKMIVARLYESIFISFILGLVVGFSVGRVKQVAIDPQSSISDSTVALPATNSGESVNETTDYKVNVLGDSDKLSELDPQIENEKVCADISGGVLNPGVYCLGSADMIIDLVKRSGGFSPSVSSVYVSRNINLSQPLEPNVKVYIPTKEEVRCEILKYQLTESITPEGSGVDADQGVITDPRGDPTGEDPDNSVIDCIDLNTAISDELTEISGIGEVTAQNIINSRPFGSIEQLLDVTGIGDAKYSQIKDSFCPI